MTKQKNQEKETTEIKTFYRALILTPYLSEDMSRDADIEEQIEKYGYDSNNLSGKKYLSTDGKSKVYLMSPEYVGSTQRQNLSGISPNLHLVIAGSTVPGEEEVSSFKGSGVIIARYSIFYGGKSKYTGNSPEATGYSLDIPKNLETVKKLLTSEEVMASLASRKISKVTTALENFNKNLQSPVLTTPYLEEILN